jgi:hypothetical protein
VVQDHERRYLRTVLRLGTGVHSGRYLCIRTSLAVGEACLLADSRRGRPILPGFLTPLRQQAVERGIDGSHHSCILQVVGCSQLETVVPCGKSTSFSMPKSPLSSARWSLFLLTCPTCKRMGSALGGLYQSVQVWVPTARFPRRVEFAACLLFPSIPPGEVVTGLPGRSACAAPGRPIQRE